MNKAWIDDSIKTPQYALIALGFVIGATTIWYFFPAIGWWPLLIVGIPIIPLLASGNISFIRTPFDIPIIIFMITAGVGVWVAYDRQAAWGKFWLLVGAVLLLYTLANQPAANHWIIAGLLTVLGCAVALFFLLTHDFNEFPVKFAPIYRLGTWITAIRPQIYSSSIHPNRVAGIIALTLPIIGAVTYRMWREKRNILAILATVIAAVVVAALLLTSSRGALLALLGSATIWILWGLSIVLARIMKARQGLIFASLLFIAIFSIILFTIRSPISTESLDNLLPGPARVGSRLDVAQAGIKLIQDYPFSGMGLGSFAGHYSQYILVIPYFIYDNGHNLLIDVAIDQGLLGLIAFAAIFFGSAAYLVFIATRPEVPHKPYTQVLTWSLLTSMLVVTIHGLVTDVIYGPWGTPLLFVIPGFALSIAQQGYPEYNLCEKVGAYVSEHKSSVKYVAIALSLVLVGLGYWFRKPLQAQWFANLGAVQMSRIELAGWPINQWDDGSNASRLIDRERYFQQALAYNPGNRTAHHRLGLIAMVKREYPSAVRHLESAYKNDPDHPGIMKNLGYSYLWANQMKPAYQILSKLPEVVQELGVYTWWWGQFGREDLANIAQTMREQLQSQQAVN